MRRMPEAMEHYWAMWNELDLDLVRGHLDRAVSDDFLFADPINFHRGRDALEANVREFRAERPEAGFTLASRIDSHNRRYRYEWNLVENGEVIVRGFDVTTLNEEGLIERIDGFFGPLRPLRKKAED